MSNPVETAAIWLSDQREVWASVQEAPVGLAVGMLQQKFTLTVEQQEDAFILARRFVINRRAFG